MINNFHKQEIYTIYRLLSLDIFHYLAQLGHSRFLPLLKSSVKCFILRVWYEIKTVERCAAFSDYLKERQESIFHRLNMLLTELLMLIEFAYNEILITMLYVQRISVRVFQTRQRLIDIL